MIGIGLSTTPNRKIINQTFKDWLKYKPADSQLEVISDDNFDGVAVTKNRLLAMLDKNEHIFLIDDDVLPLTKDWWKPYIESGEKHLMLNFRLPNKPRTDMQEVYRDDKITAWTHTRGCFLYIHRSVLDVVGGFDERYIFDFYHPDFSNRVYNAGLTKFRSMDVPDSDKLLYCYDQDASIVSSVDDKTRRLNRSKDYALYKAQRQSKEYMRYK